MYVVQLDALAGAHHWLRNFSRALAEIYAEYCRLRWRSYRRQPGRAAEADRHAASPAVLEPPPPTWPVARPSRGSQGQIMVDGKLVPGAVSC